MTKNITREELKNLLLTVKAQVDTNEITAEQAIDILTARILLPDEVD